MNFFLKIFITAIFLSGAKSDANDVMMNVLTQFFSPSIDYRKTTEPPGILPKVLNPLNWIPKFPDVPYNPDSELTTPEIIARHGYPAETHTVKTEDGYLLNIHRIPCGRLGCGDGIRQPVFLQHGILASSADFIISGPDKGIAFILADLGYDVWLSNFR